MIRFECFDDRSGIVRITFKSRSNLARFECSNRSSLHTSKRAKNEEEQRGAKKNEEERRRANLDEPLAERRGAVHLAKATPAARRLVRRTEADDAERSVGVGGLDVCLDPEQAKAGAAATAHGGAPRVTAVTLTAVAGERPSRRATCLFASHAPQSTLLHVVRSREKRKEEGGRKKAAAGPPAPPHLERGEDEAREDARRRVEARRDEVERRRARGPGEKHVLRGRPEVGEQPRNLNNNNKKKKKKKKR